MLYPTKPSFRTEGQIKSFPDKMNEKTPTPRHIIIKMPKFKDKERICLLYTSDAADEHRDV